MRSESEVSDVPNEYSAKANAVVADLFAAKQWRVLKLKRWVELQWVTDGKLHQDQVGC